MNAPNIENLIFKSELDSLSFVQFFKQLLPRGRAWQIPIEEERRIRLFGISSIEGFGLITVGVGETSMSMIGLASEEAVGEPENVGTGIAVDGLPSTEAFGVPAFVYDVFIDLSGTGIDSGETFGFVKVASIFPTGIPSEESFGTSLYVLDVLQGHDFNDGTLGSGWDSGFTDDWVIENEDGNNFAQRPTPAADRMYPPEFDELTGDFTIFWDVFVTADQGVGDESLHLELFNSSDVEQFRTEWEQRPQGITQATTVGSHNEGTIPGPKLVPMKLERIGGDIWHSFWDGAAWIRHDNFSTPGSAFSNSSDVYLKLDGSLAVNGLSRMIIVGELA